MQPSTQTPPNLESGYQRYRGLLLDVLGRLATRGYPTPPGESLDLIHDFFTEAWPGLIQRFNPALGKFVPYLYSAFSRFARPRIVKTNRLRVSLLDLESLDAIPDPTANIERVMALRETLDRVRVAITQLPKDQRRALDAYLTADRRTSERCTARSLAISRYALRNLLLEAVGHIVATIERPQGASELDWRVAETVWRDGGSIADAAIRLGLTLPQARAAHRRNGQVVAALLPTAAIPRSTNKPRTPAAMNPAKLIQSALTTRDRDTLALIRENAAKIVEFLDSDEGAEIGIVDVEATHLAAIYRALAEGLGADTESDDKVTSTILEARANQRAEVGEAFRSLLDGLSRPVMGMLAELGEIPTLDSDVQQALCLQPDITACSQAIAKRLVPWGITPIRFLNGTDAIALLAKRIRRRHGIGNEQATRLGVESGLGFEHSDVHVSVDRLAKEIAAATLCSPETSTFLYQWMIRIAADHPYLFEGIQLANIVGDTLSFHPTLGDFDDLHHRWSPVSNMPMTQDHEVVVAAVAR